MDPRCLQAASRELRSEGQRQLLETMQQQLRQEQEHNHSSNEYSELLVMTTCESWARFLPLAREFMEHTLPLVKKYLSSHDAAHRRVASSYLNAVMEGGAWTLDQALSLPSTLIERWSEERGGGG